MPLTQKSKLRILLSNPSVFAKDPAARKHEVHFLSVYQAFRSFFGVSKGGARTKNVVDASGPHLLQWNESPHPRDQM
jgi:hypothetical protein